MRIHTEYITIQSKESHEIRRLTEEVKAALKKSELTDGMVLASVLHANAAVVLGLGDEKFCQDLQAWLESHAPAREDYALGRTFESNASTVLKSILAGPQLSIAFSEGRLDLGPWQEILYLEFDGRRPKRVVLKFLGE